MDMSMFPKILEKENQNHLAGEKFAIFSRLHTAIRVQVFVCACTWSFVALVTAT
jgi:hypothetical protein